MDKYRTPAVVGLCMAMREDNEYSLAPILADALEDANCPDQELLDLLRSLLSDVEAQRLVALIHSDKTATAVATIVGIAEDLGPNSSEYGEQPMDYSVLMAGANNWLLGGDEVIVQIGSESWRGMFPSRAAKFWEAYTSVTGKPLGKVNRGTFFSCSC